MKTPPSQAILRVLKAIALIAVAVVFLIPALAIWLLLLSRQGVNWIAENHEKATDTGRDVARGTIVVSKLAILWSWLVAPTGLTAIAAAIGITSTPVIVVVAPFIVAFSGAALAMSAALELYSKRQRKKVEERR